MARHDQTRDGGRPSGEVDPSKIVRPKDDDDGRHTDRGRADVDLADLLGEHARFGIGLRVPDCRLSWDLGEDGYLSTLWLLAPDS
jgi:hypothetical protein